MRGFPKRLARFLGGLALRLLKWVGALLWRALKWLGRKIVARIDAFYRFFAETPWLSWVAHSFVSLAFGGVFHTVFHYFFEVDWGWPLGLTFAAAFYIRKEIRDASKYVKRGTLHARQREGSGATNFEDGIGDALGPVMMAIAVLLDRFLIG